MKTISMKYFVDNLEAVLDEVIETKSPILVSYKGKRFRVELIEDEEK